MKKIILLIILLTLSRKITSQTASSSDDKERKFSIGIVGSPDYSYRILNSRSEYDYEVTNRNNYQAPRISYTAGISFTWQINKRIALETGAQYSDKGYKRKDFDITIYNYGTGMFYPIDYTQEYHYGYIDIPLKANIFILTKRFKLFLSAGLAANVLVDERNLEVRLDTHGNKTYYWNTWTEPDYTKIGCTVTGCIGASYDISKRFNIRIEPIARKSLTRLNSSDIHEYLYSYGINAGVYYRF